MDSKQALATALGHILQTFNNPEIESMKPWERGDYLRLETSIPMCEKANDVARTMGMQPVFAVHRGELSGQDPNQINHAILLIWRSPYEENLSQKQIQVDKWHSVEGFDCRSWVIDKTRNLFCDDMEQWITSLGQAVPEYTRLSFPYANTEFNLRIYWEYGGFEAQPCDSEADWRVLPKESVQLGELNSDFGIEASYRAGGDPDRLADSTEWDQYLVSSVWSLPVASCLLCNINPKKIYYKGSPSLEFVLYKNWNVPDLRSWRSIHAFVYARRAVIAGDLKSVPIDGADHLQVRPREFVRWAAGIGCEIPEPLQALLQDGADSEPDAEQGGLGIRSGQSNTITRGQLLDQVHGCLLKKEIRVERDTVAKAISRDLGKPDGIRTVAHGLYERDSALKWGDKYLAKQVEKACDEADKERTQQAQRLGF